MTTRRTLTDTEIQTLADEAERGYDVDELIARRAKRGRPALGSAPATVEFVRLDPELKHQLTQRAERDGTSTSDVIREALRATSNRNDSRARQDGIRTDRTEKGREAPVTNGHSRSPTVTRKQGLTRDGTL